MCKKMKKGELRTRYQQDFSLCLGKSLPDILGVDQVDNVLAKIQNVLTSTVRRSASQ